MHFNGATASPRHKRKKRDGRRADGLGLVPQWDSNIATVLFPSLKREVQKIPVDPSTATDKPRKRPPLRPPPLGDTVTCSNQAAAHRNGVTLPPCHVSDGEVTPRHESPFVTHPRAVTPRRPHIPLRDKWTPPIVVPMHSVMDALTTVVATNKIQVDTNKRTVLHIFLHDWLEQFEKEELNYRSITVHADIGFSEINRLTGQMDRPHGIMTAFCCILLERLVPYFGQYQDLLRVLSSEVQRSIYIMSAASDQPRVLFDAPTYFSAVKDVQYQLISRLEKRNRCSERNNFLQKELKRAQLTLEATMRDWDAELTRTCFFAWYEESIVRKKVISKNLRWFSVWYSGSPRTVLVSTFEDWRSWARFHINQRITQKLQEDCEKVATAQRNVAELTEINDTLQEEFTWLQEDDTTLHDNVQLLYVQIDNAKHFLKSSPDREEAVCFDGQLRIEVVSEITHFVLESLLRSQYNLGYHQDLLGHFSLDEYCLEQFVSYVLQKPPGHPPTIEHMSLEQFVAFMDAFNTYLAEHRILFSTAAPVPSSVSPQAVAGYFQEWVIECIRQQDHYAVSPTLFFARHFEDHEISVVPVATTVSMHKSVAPVVAASRRQSIGNTEGLVNLQSITLTDLDPFTEHWRNLLIGRCFQEYGCLLFPSSDMCPYVHNPHISDLLQSQKKKKLKKSKSKASRRNLLAEQTQQEDDDDYDNESEITPATASKHYVRAYQLWKDLCSSLCQASVLDSTSASTSLRKRSPSKRSLTSQSSVSNLNRRGQQLRLDPAPHFELPASSIYVSGGQLASKKFNSFATTKLRALESTRISNFRCTIERIHDAVESSWGRSAEVKHTKHAMAQGRLVMWNSACGMAQDKECANNTSADLLTSKDVRPSLFQVINLDSPVISKLIQEEDDAESELVNVRRIFQVNDSFFRLLYTKAGPDVKYALTLDELWRAMKRLRVVTQVVPSPRDDDSAETQEISVVEFAEILLRICNEQFGELARLGQRVDRFVVEHLCFLQQAKSALREEAQSAAMKSVLSEFKELLTGIFKRYAVKPKSKEKGVRHFKLRDWMAFVKDSKLLSPRFTYEAAHDLFRNVQEGASHEDDMEMVYAEFCEAIVALAGFQLPDPFLDWPVKTSTFIHRFLCNDGSKE